MAASAQRKGGASPSSLIQNRWPSGSASQDASWGGGDYPGPGLGPLAQRTTSYQCRLADAAPRTRRRRRRALADRRRGSALARGTAGEIWTLCINAMTSTSNWTFGLRSSCLFFVAMYYYLLLLKHHCACHFGDFLISFAH